MNEIKCPKCNELFQIDESKYAEIGKQIRNSDRRK
jgi:phage FluMu protein Com